MSWNEPGGGDKDPWSGRDDQNGPPDLDEVVRSMQNKLAGIFGGGSDDNSQDNPSPKMVAVLVAACLGVWAISGFYTVEEGTRGIVTRFGKFEGITTPGLNWAFPQPIEQVQIINVEQQRYIEVGYRSGVGGQMVASAGKETVPVPKEALMLTKDENIVDVSLAVQYQVKDPEAYAFKVLDPAATLKQVIESSERGVIGAAKDMDYVMKEGRSEIAQAIKNDIQTVMDAYESGILITSVNLRDAKAPVEVKDAFDDAIKAREDKQRLINEADAYSKDVLPRARGAASRIVQEAEAYKERVISQANGDASRFTQLVGEYKKAPAITKQRLYIDAMETVLSKSSNVLVDVKSGSNMIYLPLDKLGNRAQDDGSTLSAVHEPVPAPVSVPAAKEVKVDARASSRERDVRGR